MRRASLTLILFFTFLMAAQPLMAPLMLSPPLSNNASASVTRQSRTDADDIRFGLNTRVTDGSSLYLWQVEPTLTILSDGRILCGWKEAESHNGGGYRVGFSYSTDEGYTWSTNILMETIGAGERQSDPWLVKDHNDNAYFVFLDWNSTDSGIGVAKTTNGGVTWQPTVQASDTSSGFADKETACVDENGNLYTAWDQFVSDTSANLVFTKSTNGGASFQPLTTLGNWEEWGGIPYIACTPNGTLYMSTIWDSDPEGPIDTVFMTKSVDFGATWTSPLRVNPVGTDVIDIITVTALDSLGNVYVAFGEGSQSDKDIFVTRSEDGGFTWSTPVQVNDVSTNMQRMVELHIDDDDNLHVAWLDARHDEWNYYYSCSNDSGTTFSQDVRISTEGFPLIYGRPGDYITMRSGPNGLAVVWTDGRGDDHDIYFAKQDLTSPEVEHAPIAQWWVNTPLTLQVSATDDTSIQSIELWYGANPTGPIYRMDLSLIGDAIYETTLPGAFVRGGSLYYYFVAYDGAGRTTRLPTGDAEFFTMSLFPLSPTMLITIVGSVAVIAVVIVRAIWYLRRTPKTPE